MPKHIYFLIFWLSIFSFTTEKVQAQNQDSLARAIRLQNEADKRDSILHALKQKEIKDSIDRELRKEALQRYRDSLQAAREERRRLDSIHREEIRQKAIEDRRIRDSTQQAIREETRRQAEEKKRIADSIARERQRVADSITQARIEEKKQRDLERAYKKSQRYKDSIAYTRMLFKDSLKKARDSIAEKERLKRESEIAKMKAEQSRINDSIRSVTQAKNEKLKTERQAYMDSLKEARKAYNDSINVVRQKARDSLDRKKEQLQAIREKLKTDKQKKLALKYKIHNKKKQSYTNQKFLKKGWGLRRKIYQNTVTRYNGYYNAKRKYDEAVKRLEDNSRDIYTEKLGLFPYDVSSNGASVTGDMDTVIKKCAFDTQIHDPRSKWFDDLYLLMGKAFFHKNDYERAITAFMFVINEYKDIDKKKNQKNNRSIPDIDKIDFDSTHNIRISSTEKRDGIHVLAHHNVRNEALIWLLRTYTHAEMYQEAMSLATLLKNDKQFPDRLKDDLYLGITEYELAQGNTTSAREPLQLALQQESISGGMKNRSAFLLAQLYAENGDLDSSNIYYRKALEGNVPLEMEYFAKLNMASNALKGSGNKQSSIEDLESLSRVEKFSPWRGQTYLTLGEILSEGTDTARAEKFLLKSLAYPSGDFTRGQAFERLGNIEFLRSDYLKAQVYYDSAYSYGYSSDPKIKRIDEVVLRRDVLNDLVKFTKIIIYEDSLQRLSKLPKKEQIEEARKELKRREKEEKNKLALEEAAKQTVVTLTPGNNKSNWYFYNNVSIQQGILEFEKKWGKRPLKDNWRRSNKNAFGSNTSLAENDGENESAEDGTRKEEVNKLLSGIYTKPEDFETSDTKIINAYYQIGLIYSSRLDDYDRAIRTHEMLLLRYPKNEYEKSLYYSLFLNYTKINNIPKAKEYQMLLRNEYPNTEYARLANNPGSSAQDISGDVITAFYDSTYMLFIKRDFLTALNRINQSREKYYDNPLSAKFDLIEAKSLAGIENIDSSLACTQKVIDKYPGTEEEAHAKEFLNYLQKKGNPNPPGIQEMKKEDHISRQETKLEDAVYVKDKEAEHYFLIYITKIDGNSIGLKLGLSDYARMRHSQDKLVTNMNFLTKEEAVISVRKFNNAKKAETFLNSVYSDDKLLKQVDKKDYQLMVISATNFLELLKTRDIKKYIEFYKSNY